MHTDDYQTKVILIRQYRGAKVHRCEMSSSGIAPLSVTLIFDGTETVITLSGNEMVRLVAEFNVSSIEELFV
jgi:hypothetical protein